MTHLDELLERLRTYDETTLLELLDINSDDILNYFRGRVVSRADYLAREIELLTDGSMEESSDEDACYYDEALDGYQIENVEDWDE